MIKMIIKLVFDQAKQETPNISKTGLSRHIARKIEEKDSTKIYSYKTFTRYYDKYILERSGIIDYPHADIIEALCQYLGYNNYEHFVIAQKNTATDSAHIQPEREPPVAKHTVLAEAETITVSNSLGVTKSNTSLLLKAVLIVAFTLFIQNYWNTNECMHCEYEHHSLPQMEKFIYNEALTPNRKTETQMATMSYFLENDGLCFKRNLFTTPFFTSD